MQITSNTTGMLAAVTATTDKEGRDFALTVVKGTFAVQPDGQVALTNEQAEFVFADVFHGEPGKSSLKYECDFVPVKPSPEVLVRGYAHAPGGKPVTELDVSVEVGEWRKQLKVWGDRQWSLGLVRVVSTPPEPFTQMPLVYEKAFGGWDRSHSSESRHTVERRNPIGVGFQTNSDLAKINGKSLPNVEYPTQGLSAWSDRPTPAGLGPLGRNWSPRAGFAGTYDQKWLDSRCPFLPDDFDERYYQSAPADQQVPRLSGGLAVRCRNLSPDGVLSFALPQVELPIRFRFRDHDENFSPSPDTLLLEPHRRRFMLTWRALVPVGRKFSALREVQVGKQPVAVPRRNPTPRRFASLAELARWRKAQRRTTTREGL